MAKKTSSLADLYDVDPELLESASPGYVFKDDDPWWTMPLAVVDYAGTNVLQIDSFDPGGNEFDGIFGDDEKALLMGGVGLLLGGILLYGFMKGR